MGCDIHLFTERKRYVNDNKIWVNIDNWKLNPFYKKDNNEGKEEYYELKYFIEKLERHFESEYYNKEEDSEVFRIVFWFDS